MNIKQKYRYGTRRMKVSIRRQMKHGALEWAIVENIKWGYGRPLRWGRLTKVTTSPVIPRTWGYL